jgi:hypothetical protein
MYRNGTKNGRYLFGAQKDEGPRSRLLEQDAMEGLPKPFSDAALPRDVQSLTSSELSNLGI